MIAECQDTYLHAFLSTNSKNYILNLSIWNFQNLYLNIPRSKIFLKAMQLKKYDVAIKLRSKIIIQYKVQRSIYIFLLFFPFFCMYAFSTYY